MSDSGSVDAFLARARSLAGTRVISLLDDDASPLHKGSVGTAVERALGIRNSSIPAPDVPELGLEVKTLPVSAEGRVLESTWVCVAPPESLARETWATSAVRAKLACVLFVPVEGAHVPLDERRVGTSFVWQPSDEEEAILRRDWEDLADIVANGLGFAVTARRGTALQLRPKAANAAVRNTQRAIDGDEYEGAPQGFYLRRAFTQRIVDERFGA